MKYNIKYQITLKTFFARVGLFLILTFSFCNKKTANMEKSLEEIRIIFRQDKGEIIEKYSATGAGIGKEGGDYVIVVYSDSLSKSPNEKLYWKNIPLKIRFIGHVKTQ